MATKLRRKRQQLLTDTGGNTLMLIAGMFLPLLAMVGSGIDMSRAYLTKARLQSACDAGALATRKVLVGQKLNNKAAAIGNRYFKANFGHGAFGSYNVSFVLSDSANGQIDGVAKAKLDTGIMQVFGQTAFDLTVTCSAIRDLSHTDIMFVLDTTGSMLQSNPGDSASRFETMKTAVRDFHTTLETSKSSGVNLRYGFVPYSEMVNVGGLLTADMMVSRWTYQSRIPDGVETTLNTRSYDENFRQVGGGAASSTTSTFSPTSEWVPPTSGSGGEFGSGGSAGYWRQTCPTPSDTLSISNKTLLNTQTKSFKGPPKGTQTIETYRETWNGTKYSANYNGSVCEMTTSNYNNSIFEYDWITEPSEDNEYFWRYRPVEFDVSKLVDFGPGSTMKVKIGTNHTDRTITWQGCIEERDTVMVDNFSPLPGDAYDLDIDSKPTNDVRTQWRPALPELIFRRPNVAEERTSTNYDTLAQSWGGAQRMCPAAAKRMSPMTSTELDLYLQSLVAQGGTHHDIGLLWGARLISPSGIFSGANSGPQSRHIVFMTDGQVETNVTSHDAYGYPWLDRRRLPFPATDPTDAKLNEIVEKRFLAICEAAKSRGITIWSIAFGTSLSPAMETCAGSNRAFEANNSTELDFAFREIAGGIARLRLTK